MPACISIKSHHQGLECNCCVINWEFSQFSSSRGVKSAYLIFLRFQQLNLRRWCYLWTGFPYFWIRNSISNFCSRVYSWESASVRLQMSADSSFKLSLSFHWIESTWTSQRAEKYCKLWFSFQFWFQTCLVCARLFTGEIERNYGNFSLSTMNGDISLLGQNCARDDFHHISLFLDHNGRTVDTSLQEMLIDLENWF